MARWTPSHPALFQFNLVKRNFNDSLAFMPSLAYYPIINGVVLLLGFAREIVVSSHFGISSEIDVYAAVLCFQSFFGVQVGNATESVFVSKAGALPSIVHIRAQLIRSFKDLVWFNLLTIPLILLFSGRILPVIVPGFSESQIQQGKTILNLILISAVAANVSGAFRAALNIQKIFLPGFLAGGIISCSIILSVFLLEKRLGVIAIAVGLLAGHSVVLALYGFIWRGIWRSFASACRSANKIEFMPSLSKAVGVVLIAEIFYQVFTVTQRGFSSEIASGTIAAFFYTEVLVAVPVALFAVPLSTILFPRLAKAFSIQTREGMQILGRYGVAMFAASLILVAAVNLFSEPIVSTVFVRGRFTLQDSDRTAALLRIMILALPFMSIGSLLKYALYSMSIYRASIYSNVIMWLMLVVAGFLLIPNHGASGLAWATVFAVVAQTISMLIMVLLKKGDTDYAKT